MFKTLSFCIFSQVRTSIVWSKYCPNPKHSNWKIPSNEFQGSASNNSKSTLFLREVRLADNFFRGEQSFVRTTRGGGRQGGKRG